MAKKPIILETAAGRAESIILIGDYEFEARTATITETFALRRIGEAVNQTRGSGENAEKAIKDGLEGLVQIVNRRAIGDHITLDYLMEEADSTFIRNLIRFFMMGTEGLEADKPGKAAPL